MSVKLGELLVEAGLLTQAQLEATLKNQVIYGGRLGTNLIELGYLPEEDLARFLSKKLELPCATSEQLMSVPPDIIKLIPKEVAEKYRVIPLGRDKKRLTLAMLDPADLSVIDAISFITGFFISPLIAPELRLVMALEKYYGVKRDVRYIQMTEKKKEPPAPIEAADEAEPPHDPFFGESAVREPQGFDFSLPPEEDEILDIEDVMGSAVAPAAAEPAETAPTGLEPDATDPFRSEPDMTEEAWPEPAGLAPAQKEFASQEPVAAVAHGPGAAEEGFIDIDLVREEPPQELFAAPTPEEPPKAAQAPLTAESVAELLAGAEDRDAIADAIISYLGSEFDRVALFMVKGNVAEGWKAVRDKTPLPAFEGLQLSLNEQSVLKIVNDGKSFYLGPVPDTPGNVWLLAALGGNAPSSALLVPLLILGRLVAVLYVDGDKSPIAGRLSELQKLVTKMGMAFEILILKNKILMT
ncbi:MAG TPA: hypothetical protein VF799_02530 [Geobacteraceae bacterium]